eukprot:1155149-Pelagomonas_calceolata.AAC.1
MALLLKGMGSVDNPTHTQEDWVDSDLCLGGMGGFKFDTGCAHTLSELNRLLGPIVLLRSVISVIWMTYKINNMCCSDVPVPKSALSTKSMPHYLSTTFFFYIFISSTGCPV